MKSGIERKSVMNPVAYSGLQLKGRGTNFSSILATYILMQLIRMFQT